jgi:hypothetical protein
MDHYFDELVNQTFNKKRVGTFFKVMKDTGLHLRLNQLNNVFFYFFIKLVLHVTNNISFLLRVFEGFISYSTFEV